ncbi:MAG: aldo/keto reductase [Pseudomonadales bacterium]
MTLPQHALGNTGMTVSALALGTVKFGRNTDVKYPTDFALPSDADIKNLLREAADLGINLLDTAPAYGTSEQRLGAALRGQRQQWLLCSKVGEQYEDGVSRFDFKPEAVAPSIARSLRRLGTDYLDLALIHSDGNDLHILDTLGTLDALRDQQRRGLVRAIGMSHKTLEGGYRALALGADVLMTTLNADDMTAAPLIAQCQQDQCGVLIKKALGSGHSGSDSLQKVAATAGVSSIVVGTLNAQHLRANVATVATVLRG